MPHHIKIAVSWIVKVLKPDDTEPAEKEKGGESAEKILMADSKHKTAKNTAGSGPDKLWWIK